MLRADMAVVEVLAIQHGGAIKSGGDENMPWRSGKAIKYSNARSFEHSQSPTGTARNGDSKGIMRRV